MNHECAGIERGVALAPLPECSLYSLYFGCIRCAHNEPSYPSARAAPRRQRPAFVRMNPIGACAEHVDDRELFRSPRGLARHGRDRSPAPSSGQRNSVLKMPALQQLGNRYAIA
jgi:hypothetical protein